MTAIPDTLIAMTDIQVDTNPALPIGLVVSADGTLINWRGVNYEIQTDAHRQVRTLKWRVKQLGKQLGKAGQTIHELRGANAALRMIANYSPGDWERVLNTNRRLAQDLLTAQVELAALREKQGF